MALDATNVNAHKATAKTAVKAALLASFPDAEDAAMGKLADAIVLMMPHIVTLLKDHADIVGVTLGVGTLLADDGADAQGIV